MLTLDDVSLADLSELSEIVSVKAEKLNIHFGGADKSNLSKALQVSMS